jgi:hypothetical protein
MKKTQPRGFSKQRVEESDGPYKKPLTTSDHLILFFGFIFIAWILYTGFFDERYSEGTFKMFRSFKFWDSTPNKNEL